MMEAYELDDMPGEDIFDDYEEESTEFLESLLDQGNILEHLEDIPRHTQKTIELYEDANQSMDGWRKKYKRALNLAKLQAMSGESEISEKNFPFEGASLAMLPFITEAMLDFNARSAPELVWKDNIVAAKIYGEHSKVQSAEGAASDPKEERAERISKYMNYQLMEEMQNWRDEQDKNLFILPCVGTSYKKSYFDHDKKMVISELYLADQVIFNHNFKNFSDAPDHL